MDCVNAFDDCCCKQLDPFSLILASMASNMMCHLCLDGNDMNDFTLKTKLNRFSPPL